MSEVTLDSFSRQLKSQFGLSVECRSIFNLRCCLQPFICPIFILWWRWPRVARDRSLPTITTCSASSSDPVWFSYKVSAEVDVPRNIKKVLPFCSTGGERRYTRTAALKCRRWRFVATPTSRRRSACSASASGSGSPGWSSPSSSLCASSSFSQASGSSTCRLRRRRRRRRQPWQPNPAGMVNRPNLWQTSCSWWTRRSGSRPEERPNEFMSSTRLIRSAHKYNKDTWYINTKCMYHRTN